MIQYATFFKIRFLLGLQYRAAALAGIITQFVWGAMELLLFRAFYQADPQAFPMTFEALANYIWLQQAFLALFMLWFWENDLFEAINTGNVVYELCRPVSLYGMWYVRSLAGRLSKAVLRCAPILFFAMFLPRPYALTFSGGAMTIPLFLISLLLGVLLAAAFSMLIYMSCFFTINSMGIRMIVQSLGDILSGAVIPLPFFPDKLRGIVELLPFASIQNVPLRIFSGDISGNKAYFSIGLQLFWLILFFYAGKLLEQKGLKKLIIQGG